MPGLTITPISYRIYGEKTGDMLAIKLRPVGKKHQKTYRVIVAEKRSKLDGRFVDDLGWMNPHTDTFNVKVEAAKKWISNGAQPTPSVHNILVRAGAIDGPKIPVHATSKKKGDGEPQQPVQSPAQNSEPQKPSEEPEKQEQQQDSSGDSGGTEEAK